MMTRLAWGGLLAVSMTLSFHPVEAPALSLCINTDGQQVLTDSPGQFSRCTSIESNSGSDAVRTPPPPQEPVPPSRPESQAMPTTAPHESVPVSASAASITVPIERLGSLLVVQAHLNHDRTARLILDTGASHTLLSHTIAQDLGLFSTPPVALVTLHTVGGSVQSEVVQVDSIELAGAEVRQSLAAIHDMPDAPPGIEGLLGQSFLRQFEVTVNAAKGELQLRSPR